MLKHAPVLHWSCSATAGSEVPLRYSMVVSTYPPVPAAAPEAALTPLGRCFADAAAPSLHGCCTMYNVRSLSSCLPIVRLHDCPPSSHPSSSIRHPPSSILHPPSPASHLAVATQHLANPPSRDVRQKHSQSDQPTLVTRPLFTYSLLPSPLPPSPLRLSTLPFAIGIHNMPAKRIRCTAKDCKEPAQRIVGDCSFCNGHFCGRHRLLEDHKCSGLEDVWLNPFSGLLPPFSSPGPSLTTLPLVLGEVLRL